MANSSGHNPPAAGRVFWLFGLSGAGKTTLATALAGALRAGGRQTLVLDGDILRQGLCHDLGFTDEARFENVRRVAEIARLAAEQGNVVIVALITPGAAMRKLARDIVGGGRIHLVWVDAPLAVCRQRDPKGLYRQSDAGNLPLFTGVGSPFEVPTDFDLRLRSDLHSEPELAGQLLDFCLRELG